MTSAGVMPSYQVIWRRLSPEKRAEELFRAELIWPTEERLGLTGSCWRWCPESIWSGSMASSGRRMTCSGSLGRSWALFGGCWKSLMSSPFWRLSLLLMVV